MRSAILAAAILLCGNALGARVDNPDWKRPFEPHRIVGNVYYVGGYDLASFLITSPQGHILINTGLADSPAAIARSIVQLGFKVEDVHWLLTTQAHYDHVEGMAEMKRLTGAKLFATAPDAAVLEDGGKSDFHWGREFWFPPVKVDMRLVDGQTINLGATTLKVYVHAGHTRGSASYMLTAREGERFYTVMIANIGSINNGVRLTNNAAYPSIADDYARTFERQKALKVDIFLASHAGQYGLHAKYSPGMPYDPNRFVDPDGYRRAVEGAEAGYRRQLAAERGDDRAKIAELRRVDAAATRGGDTDVLIDLLDDEIVALMPGREPMIGKAAVRKLMEQYAVDAAHFETVSYVQDWRDLRIESGYAFEWGIFTSTVRQRENGKTTESINKVMRVLKRQPDGFWKVFCTTMN